MAPGRFADYFKGFVKAEAFFVASFAYKGIKNICKSHYACLKRNLLSGKFSESFEYSGFDFR